MAVTDPMVRGKRDVHEAPRHDAARNHPGALDELAKADDGNLGRVDDAEDGVGYNRQCMACASPRPQGAFIASRFLSAGAPLAFRIERQ